jgi:ferredoxin, 2Fe-2S
MPEVMFQPEGKKVSVRPGVSLLDAARRARVQIRSRCSGGLSCLMCKVRVIEGAGGLTPPQANEKAKLGELEGQGYRYSCQAKVLGDSVVELPEDPLKAAVRAQQMKQREEEGLW